MRNDATATERFGNQEVERIADAAYGYLQARVNDPEMFLGWVDKGGETVMGSSSAGNLRVGIVTRDYLRITDGGCSEQFMIALEDCRDDLAAALAPVIEWYEEVEA